MLLIIYFTNNVNSTKSIKLIYRTLNKPTYIIVHNSRFFLYFELFIVQINNRF